MLKIWWRSAHYFLRYSVTYTDFYRSVPKVSPCPNLRGYWTEHRIHIRNYDIRILFSARCNIYISRLCHDASPSVRLSVTEVHWCVIANLGFKFRSHFTAHCKAAVLVAGAVLLAGESSCAMLASARVSCSECQCAEWRSVRQFCPKLVDMAIGKTRSDQ